VSSRITPLRLEAFDQLPKHARRCVFWEVDPSTLGGDDHLADPEFEKEAWLSMVMLEWGSCGQIAVECAPEPGQREAAPAELLGESACLGYAFYAPPRAVPRARRFPTGPVSADAVLLTSLGVDACDEAGVLPRGLIAAVVADLVRRGVRALEAFGRTSAMLSIEPAAVPPDLQPVLEVLGDCSPEQCIIDVELLAEAGFEVVSPHPYVPRLRLELEQGLGWKADVEAALERLLESARIEVPVGAVPCG
jgi:hypothetical protein